MKKINNLDSQIASKKIDDFFKENESKLNITKLNIYFENYFSKVIDKKLKEKIVEKLITYNYESNNFNNIAKLYLNIDNKNEKTQILIIKSLDKLGKVAEFVTELKKLLYSKLIEKNYTNIEDINNLTGNNYNLYLDIDLNKLDLYTKVGNLREVEKLIISIEKKVENRWRNIYCKYSEKSEVYRHIWTCLDSLDFHNKSLTKTYYELSLKFNSKLNYEQKLTLLMELFVLDNNNLSLGKFITNSLEGYSPALKESLCKYYKISKKMNFLNPKNKETKKEVKNYKLDKRILSESNIYDKKLEMFKNELDERELLAKIKAATELELLDYKENIISYYMLGYKESIKLLIKLIKSSKLELNVKVSIIFLEYEINIKENQYLEALCNINELYLYQDELTTEQIKNLNQLEIEVKIKLKRHNVRHKRV